MIHSFQSSPVRCSLPPSEWWNCPRPDPSAPLRMWCLPFVGAGAAIWHPWAMPLAGAAEIAAVRLPGRETRLFEGPFTRATDVIAALANRIAPQLGEPYVLCGHSLGGLLAFELAREFRARGLAAPRALIVCGTRAPHVPRVETDLHPLPPYEFIPRMERRYGAIPAEIRAHPEFLELLLPVLRADLEVYETYRFQSGEPLEMPILALGGADDAIVSRVDVTRWRTHTTGRFEAEFVPGGHFFPQERMAETTALVREFLATVAPAKADPCLPKPNRR